MFSYACVRTAQALMTPPTRRERGPHAAFDRIPFPTVTWLREFGATQYVQRAAISTYSLTTYNAGCRYRRVARTRILRRLIERERVAPKDLFSRQQVGEAAAHRPNIDGRAFPALGNCQAKVFASAALGSRNR